MQARLFYEERYPEQNTLSRQTFINIYKLFRSTGSVDVRKHKCKNPMTKEDNEINILAAIAVNPHVSTRKIARQVGMSQSKNSTFQNQINFCQWGLHQNRSFFLISCLRTKQHSVIMAQLIYGRPIIGLLIIRTGLEKLTIKDNGA